MGTASDGDEGLEKFGARHWDVVVTDLQMPRMTGEELALAIQRENPAFPVIIITGAPDGVRNPERFHGVLSKPFWSEALLALIDGAPSVR